MEDQEPKKITLDLQTNIIAMLMPYIILGKFAHWAFIVTAILAFISLFVTLPFHYLWGFPVLLFIGGFFAIRAGRADFVTVERTD